MIVMGKVKETFRNIPFVSKILINSDL